MSALTVYSYPKCSTCTKAVRYLDSLGVDYSLIDISNKGPSQKELRTMLKAYDGALRKLVNTSGKRYRELDMKTKITTTSERELIAMLAKDGMLVKRPFVLGDDVALVGFREAEWQEALS